MLMVSKASIFESVCVGFENNSGIDKINAMCSKV